MFYLADDTLPLFHSLFRLYCVCWFLPGWCCCWPPLHISALQLENGFSCWFTGSVCVCLCVIECWYFTIFLLHALLLFPFLFIDLKEISHIVGHLFDEGVIELLDVAQGAPILLGHKVDGDTFAAETTTSTDSGRR